MSKNKILKFNIIIVVFMLFFGLGCVFFTPAPTTSVSAANSEQLQIENDNTVISSELWVALYNAYKNVTGELPAGDVLTLNMFTNLDASAPKTLNLSTDSKGQSYQIKSIAGLAEFDLTFFETVNLSGNNISSIGNELKNLTNLKELNLSKNHLSSFNTAELDESCLTTLQTLNLSQNALITCNLTGLTSAKINLSGNNLSDGITYPEADLVINLNNNNVLSVNSQKTNIVYGFQGVKNNQNFERQTEIMFVPNASLEFTKIEIYENEQLFNTLTEAQKVTLPVGNYSIKFLNGANIEVVDAITFKVLLPKVTAKLFVNGKEIEFTSVLTENTTIKFYGEDGAEIYFSTNNMQQDVKATEYTIDTNGIVIVTAYQTKDGYYSSSQSFYFQVKKPTIGSWIIVGLGVVGLVGLYFGLRFVLDFVIKKTSKSPNIKTKGKLD